MRTDTEKELYHALTLLLGWATGNFNPLDVQLGLTSDENVRDVVNKAIENYNKRS